jgi:preprotein translocase subunit SecA
MAFPGLVFGDAPERAEPRGATHWKRAAPLAGGSRLLRRAEEVMRQTALLQGLPPAAFDTHRAAVQAGFARHGLQSHTIDAACACAAEAARRALGLSAYLPQLTAALAMLDKRMAEVATGEGKSLAAALAASIGALAGLPVHVLTANDYLVQRDAESFAPLYHALGLSVAAVVAGLPPAERRAAYAQDVTYATAREVAFDYLRDRISHGAPRDALKRRARALAQPAAEAPLLRGLCMAVIDEADNILIDEAQMPLVLSREAANADSRAHLWQAFALSGKLIEEQHFILHGTPRVVRLTERGRGLLATLAEGLGPLWKNIRHRDETVTTALTARHLLVRDRDYVLTPICDPASGQDGSEITIVDRFSGRLAEGRKWSHGLHALVAIKEGCSVPPELDTLARISFQRFFRRYHRLAGMSGTLFEASSELRALYGCALLRVPPRLPSRHTVLPTRCYADDAARRHAVVRRTRQLVAEGRPVLVGCDSVEASRAMSEALLGAGITHRVLDARFDREEADIVAAAGRAAQVTVATSMAGRGTDIRLDAEALAAGGLHVLSCQHNASARHDRQLAGRAARQGEPGSSESWTTLAALRDSMSPLADVLAAFARTAPDGHLRLPASLLDAWLASAQRLGESRQARLRRRLFRQDLASDGELSFAGPME